MSDHSPVPVVCAILLHEGKVLLAQRPEGKHLALLWEFPGGKVDEHESPEAAIAREMQEELGCEIEIARRLASSCHEYERGVIELIPFVCHLRSGTAMPQPHEHASIRWVEPADVARFHLAPADLPVLSTWLGAGGQ